MSPKRYPPLTPDEVIKILQARGFQKIPKSGSSHVKYEGFINGKRRVVTVDVKEKEFGVPLMHSIISQSGLSREEFYNTLDRTAKKIR